MVAFRFFSALFLLVAVVAAVDDATPALAGANPFSATALIDHWHELAPNSLVAAKAAVTDATGEWLWTGVVEQVLGLPTFVLFGLLALASGYVGRRRQKIEIFIN